MRNFRDFQSLIVPWIIETGGDPTEKQLRELWDRLELRGYAERLYILQKDDVRNEAENMEIDMTSLEENEQFWELVKDGIESGMMGWDTNIQEAIKEAIRLLEE